MAYTTGDKQREVAELRLERVSFDFGARDIVRDVSLVVRPGERVGLLGPNGAGKSTLLRLMCGILRPKSGQVWLGDQHVRQLGRQEIARRVAVVPQEFSVQFAYTVRQLVELGRTPHTGAWGVLSKGDETEVDTALDATDLTTLADRIFNSLSGGERQRVLVAMALAQQSPLVLLDEPTAHLDIRHQIELLDLLSRLNQEQKLTVVAALHDLNLAARYFPRMVLFRHEIVADGSPATVLDPALLTQVYGTPVRVGILRGDVMLSVLPPSERENGSAMPRNTHDTQQPLVHVIAGAGSGEMLMRALADVKVPFSAGALSVGDTDYELARQLATTCVSNLPYAPVSAEALAATQVCMAEAGATVVCPALFGPGNVALVTAALRVAMAGGLVVLYEPDLGQRFEHNGVQALVPGWQARDLADGRVVQAYQGLLDAGAKVVATPHDLVVLLRSSRAAALTDTSADERR